MFFGLNAQKQLKKLKSFSAYESWFTFLKFEGEMRFFSEEFSILYHGRNQRATHA